MEGWQQQEREEGAMEYVLNDFIKRQEQGATLSHHKQSGSGIIKLLRNILRV